VFFVSIQTSVDVILKCEILTTRSWITKIIKKKGHYFLTNSNAESITQLH